LRSFRFGAITYWANVPAKQWIPTVRRLEEIGYSTIFEADHFGKNANDPVVMLSSAAAATEKIHLGTLVFDVDYRHPVILARTAAALHLLSDGRFEFGIGAGWSRVDYDMAGIPFDPPGVRIRRLDEALQIIRSMWTEDNTTFHGKHYRITNMVKAGDLPDGEHPKIMVGGGGRKLLTVAGRHADIVGIQWPIPGGSFSGRSIRDTTIDHVKRRIEWVKTAAEKAGRNPDDIEFQMLFPHPRITDEPESVMVDIANNWGVTVEEVTECPQWLIGSSSDIVEKLRRLRDETGINYMVFGPTSAEQFIELAESVLKPLSS